VTRIRNPTKPLDLALQPEEIKAAIGKLNLGLNFESLQFTTDKELNDFWCAQTDKERLNEGLGPSVISSTMSYMTKLNQMRVQQAKLMSRRLSQLQKAKIRLPAPSKAIIDDARDNEMDCDASTSSAMIGMYRSILLVYTCTNTHILKAKENTKLFPLPWHPLVACTHHSLVR